MKIEDLISVRGTLCVVSRSSFFWCSICRIMYWDSSSPTVLYEHNSTTHNSTTHNRSSTVYNTTTPIHSIPIHQCTCGPDAQYKLIP